MKLIINLFLFLTFSLFTLCVKAGEADAFLEFAQQQNIEDYKPDEKTKKAVEAAINGQYKLTEKDKQTLAEMQGTINSKEFADQQEAWRNQIGSALGVNDWKSQDASKGDSEESRIPYSEKPIIFASASVPLQTLRNYARDLEKIDGVIVIRGFVGGMKAIRPTFEFLDSVIKKDLNCPKTKVCEHYKVQVLIDPILFREYGIKRVPAFAVHEVTNLTKYCNGNEGLNPSPNLVYGDSSIKYMLDRLYQETKRPVIKKLWEKL